MLTHTVSKLYIDLDVCLPPLLFLLLLLSLLNCFPHSTAFKCGRLYSLALHQNKVSFPVVLTQWDFKGIKVKQKLSCEVLFFQVQELVLLSKSTATVWSSP
jgi:hypothetical protein